MDYKTKGMLWSLRLLYVGLRSFILEHGYRFGKDLIDLEGPIPAHLLGSMWADSWANLGSTVNPYPGNPTTNVTSAMRKQKWSEKTMFEKGSIFV